MMLMCIAFIWLVAPGLSTTGDSALDSDYTFPPLSVSSAGSMVASVRKVKVAGFVGGSSGLEIAVNREPLVVTHTSASKWSALGWNLRDMSSTTWTNLYDVLSMPVPDSAKCSESESTTFSSPQKSIFHVHDTTAGSATIKNTAPGSAVVPPQLVKEMSLQHFLDEANALTSSGVSQNKKMRRLMYSDNFAEMEAELQLGADTTWRDYLINEFDCSTNSSDSAQCDESAVPSPLFNMLHPGVVLQARFTEYHTMRVQLQGRAVYHLFPPHYANTALHIYPSVHRCANQAQVNMYEEGGTGASTCPGNAARKHSPLFPAPLAENTPPVAIQKVALNPGEVLYVPPYWLVHSEAATLSLSIDVLSVSKEQLLLMPADHMGLPFKEEQVATKEQRIVSAQVFLVHVLSRVQGFTSVLKYARSLYQSRFAALYPEDGLYLQKSRFQCLRDQTKKYNSIVKKLHPESIEAAAAFVAARLNDPLLRSTLVDIGSTDDPVPHPQRGVRWIWLGNYVEQIARWAMGDAEEVVLFIRECLHMDSVLEIIEEVEGPSTISMQPQEDQ